MNATYQDTWPNDRRLGWLGTLPLRPTTKGPPPEGFTGWDGLDPSPADCAEFDELPAYRGTCQKAYRMGATVVGVDVDAYGGRTGGATLTEAARRWGPLPTGPWSSARDDGVSGIRFFRVPDGTVLLTCIGFAELRVGHVEVIQRHHRYAVVAPSIHPATRTRYTWRGTSGPDRPPAVEDLPDLPATWLTALAGTGTAGERARPEQVDRFLAALPPGAMCLAVRAALEDGGATVRNPLSSRHDDTCASVLRLLRLAERGHPGVPEALAVLRGVFAGAVTADGSRTPASADAEFDRMREGANGIGLIEATPTPPGRRGCRCATEQGPPSRAALTGIIRAVLNTTGDDRRRLLAWATRKLRGYAAAGQLDDTYVRNVVEQLHNAAGGDRQ